KLLDLLLPGFNPRLGLFEWQKRNEARAIKILRLKFLRTGIGIARALEQTVERVVILLRDRVVFVIVATRATKRQSQEGAAGCLDGVLDGQMHQLERRGGIAARQ